MKRIRLLCLLTVFSGMLCTCGPSRNRPPETPPGSTAQPAQDSLAGSPAPASSATDTLETVSPGKPKPNLAQMPDSGFVEVIRLDSTFVLDLRYATPNNFLHEKVYDCAKCLLRKEAALALVKANNLLKAKGYRLRLFDCYRPLDVQKKMWKIKPDDRFVGNPYGNGSMHNKGAAVDLSLTDSTGRELDMGTPFDFFGREAYQAYTNLPTAVLARRQLLRQTLVQAGFSPITSEWWHYSYNRRSYGTSNFKPECE